MKRSKWNSPQSMRRRTTQHINREADTFNRTMPSEMIDTEYTDGRLLANAELLLKDAVDASLTRDLSVASSIYGALKTGDHETFNSTPNQRDYGMSKDEDYATPAGWNLPNAAGIYDQRDRLTKICALVMMEIERLDRMGLDARSLGYDIFNPTARADKKLADEAIAKQSSANRKREMLDISNQLRQTAGQIPAYGSANVTASTQPQFTGTIQPVPQAVPCPVR